MTLGIPLASADAIEQTILRRFPLSDYARCANSVISTAKCNPSLCERHGCDSLIYMDEDNRRKGTELEVHFVRRRQEKETQERILQGESKSGIEIQVDEKYRLACKRCKASDEFIVMYDKQSRAADEAMDTKYKCTKCGFRWKD
jgi:DNA-directed RNA polymerase subunit M/transcription elongation factor TFIIS